MKPAAPVGMYIGIAPLEWVEEELEELPVLDGVEPCPDGLACSPAQVKVPLMTLLLPARDWKVEQSSVMSAEDWRLKAPRTSLRDGRVTLHEG